MHPLSNFIWIYFQSIGSMLTQYGRLSLALTFIISIIVGYFTLFIIKKEKLIYLLLIIVIGSTILNWGHRRTIPEVTDVILQKNVPYSTLTEGPSYYVDTIWADPKQFWFSNIPNQHLEIINGQGEVKQLQRTTIMHTYQVIASTPLSLKENTLYFPGWQATCNNKPININPGERGVITFTLAKGNCILKVFYKDLPILLATKIISIISIILIIAFVGLSLSKKLRKFPKF